MDTNFATSPSDSNHRPLRRGRVAIAAMLIACIGMNSAFATGLAQRAAQQINAAVEVTLNEVAVDQQLIQSIDAPRRRPVRRAAGHLCRRCSGSPRRSQHFGPAKSWKTVLARRFSSRPRSRPPCVPLANAPTSGGTWAHQPGAGSNGSGNFVGSCRHRNRAGAVGVPPSWAKIIAKVLAFFL